MKNEQKKTRQVQFRVTTREYRLICAKAEFLGMNVSDYVRDSVINRRLKGFKFDEPVKVHADQMTIYDLDE